jgi:hypothetical protein
MNQRKFKVSTDAQELTVDAVIGRRVAHDSVAAARREIIFAINLILAAIGVGRSGPDVNVRFPVVVVGDFRPVSKRAGWGIWRTVYSLHWAQSSS